MIIHIVRHGETQYNVLGKYAGSTDVPLNAKGLSQAEELCEKIKDIHYDAVISSPLLRAKQTADKICARRNMQMDIHQSFSERNVGVYEGLTQDEIKVKYPALWQANSTRLLDGAPTGGETLRQFSQRVDKGLDELLEIYMQKSVLLVCHAGVARELNRYIRKLSYDDMHSFTLKNCAVAQYII